MSSTTQIQLTNDVPSKLQVRDRGSTWLDAGDVDSAGHLWKPRGAPPLATDESTLLPNTTWVKARDGKTVIDYGAVPDWTGTPGVGTDNTIAFQNALTANSYLIIPPGRYRLTGGLSTTSPTVSIMGAGIGVTEVVFDGTVSTGILLDGTGATASDRQHTTITDLSITTTQIHTGLALSIKQWPSIASPRGPRKVFLSNVLIKGDVSTTQGWDNAIELHDCQQVQIQACGILGQGGKASPNDTQADQTLSNVAINIIDTAASVPDAIDISDTYIYWWKTGILAGTGGGHQTLQGLSLLNSGILCRVGIDVQASTVVQRVVVTSSHINAYLTAVKTRSANDVILVNNLFFINPDSTEALPKLIDLGAIARCMIDNNILYGFVSTAGGTPGPAIELSPVLNDCHVTKSNSIFSITTGFSHGVHILSGISFNRNYINPSYDGAFTVDAYVDDNALTAAKGNIVGVRGASLLRTSAQSIPDTTSTQVVSMALIFDNGAFVGTDDLTIPANSGIVRARVSGGVTFASNSTGFREIWVQKNGASFYTGWARETHQAATGVTHVGAATSGPLVVAAGDVFKLFVRQTSGGALDVTNSWMTIEALN